MVLLRASYQPSPPPYPPKKKSPNIQEKTLSPLKKFQPP